MKILDEQIPDIQRLDEHRQKAVTLQKEAIHALTAHPYVPWKRPSNSRRPSGLSAKPTKAGRPNWKAPGDDVEKAMMLVALSLFEGANKKNQEDTRNAIREDLRAIRWHDFGDTPVDEFAGESAPDTVPILRAALVLQAMVKTGACAASPCTLVCFSVIVRELNEVVPPIWAGGAARASERAAATSFVTGECARALLAFEEALKKSARAVELLGKAASNTKFRANFKAWQDQQDEFSRQSLKASLEALGPGLLFELPKEPKDAPAKLLEDVAGEVAALVKEWRSTATRSPRAKKAGRARNAANGAPAPRMYEVAKAQLATTAGEIAEGAVQRLLQVLQQAAVAKARVRNDPAAAADRIASALKVGAQIVRDLVLPVKNFAMSVIDRELAAASPQLGLDVDAAELVFAANLLGSLAGWEDPRVKSACEVVCPRLMSDGRLTSIRPFNVRSSGYRLSPATLEVTRRLADLVANRSVDLEPQFVERLMRPFDDTRAYSQEEQSERGWTTGVGEREPESEWWVTALAVDALESCIRMLDSAINREVLQHFQVRKPGDLKLDLDDLFYPDFGVVALEKEKGRKVKSIAEKLQQLRAHAGRGPAEGEPLFSLILYGPPGTGKTTLVEALARSADVPLVEITPSDILVGGAEAVERRTRHVFQALSELTHAVVLFDEFDSILQDRAKRPRTETLKSVFEFLTPGMLPKLKALHEAAKEQRVSYVLATNFIYDLDPAVIRKGRFDDAHGIFPPDAVSRAGRLLDQAQRRRTDVRTRMSELKKSLRKAQDSKAKKRLQEDLGELHTQKVIGSRILQAVKKTGGGPMDQFGRPGWFTSPGSKPKGGPLFDFIGNRTKDFPPVLPEAAFPTEWKKFVEQQGTPANGGSPSALTDDDETAYYGPFHPFPTKALRGKEKDYWTEWLTIDEMESAFKKCRAGRGPNWNSLWNSVIAMMDQRRQEAIEGRAKDGKTSSKGPRSRKSGNGLKASSAGRKSAPGRTAASRRTTNGGTAFHR